jgi:hypothetical protein
MQIDLVFTIIIKKHHVLQAMATKQGTYRKDMKEEAKCLINLCNFKVVVWRTLYNLQVLVWSKSTCMCAHENSPKIQEYFCNFFIIFN